LIYLYANLIYEYIIDITKLNSKTFFIEVQIKEPLNILGKTLVDNNTLPNYMCHKDGKYYIPSTLLKNKKEGDIIRYKFVENPDKFGTHTNEVSLQLTQLLHDDPKLKNKFEIVFNEAAKNRTKDVAALTYIAYMHTAADKIGRDQSLRDEIAKHMRTADGNPIELDSNTLFLQMGIIVEGSIGFGGRIMCADRYLPSTIFEGKKDGDVIEYYWDNRLVKLTLSQKR